MAPQSLYRRYRPQRFDEIKGQDHVVRALRNASAEDRVGHAYLFSGPRGTGKTSTARILAKVLNCEDPVDGEPCGVCDSCVAVEAGNSFDVTELDAASNRRIDDVRDLIATTALASPGRTRLYILDEVHMLTKEASAALLKTLEEPPDHVVFVLATTDPQLVLPTIRSRTQHLEFTLLPAGELTALVDEVVADAGLDVNAEGVARALRDGGGSARDTLSALDRIVATGGVTDEGRSIADLMEALAERDTGAALVALHEAIEQGRDPRVVGEQLLSELRDAFLVLMQGQVTHLTDEVIERVRAHADRLRAPAITRALESVGEALVEMRQASDPRVPLEVALVRLTRPELDTSPAALVERMERLERRVRAGVDDQPTTTGSTDRPTTGTDEPASRPSPASAARERLAATGGAGAEAGQSASSGGTGQSPAASAERSGSGDGPTDPSGDAATRRRPALGRRRQGATGAADRGGPEVASTGADEGPTTSQRPAAGADSGSPTGAASAGAPPSTPASRGDAVVNEEGTPTREALTLAWGDTLLDGMRPKIRALFAAGRFVGVDQGRARFALPNAAHRDRCEPYRPDVEKALAAHFGGPVPMALVVEGAAAESGSSGSGGDAGATATDRATRPTGTGPAGATGADDGEAEDEMVDVGELEDAGAATTGVDQLAAVFGEVEVVEPSGEDPS